ncbi:MAG: YrhK family protein [Cyanobacteria bacterium P01_H01_bin.121]
MSRMKLLRLLRDQDQRQILSDWIVGVCFLIGSLCFWWPSTVHAGVGFFVIGSLQLVITPTLKLRDHWRQLK